MSMIKQIPKLTIVGQGSDQGLQVSLPPLPPQIHSPVEAPLAQQLECMQATGEIFQQAMYQMSEIERRAAYLTAVTSMIRDHQARQIDPRYGAPAEYSARQERFENYLLRLGQLAELGNKALILEAGKATETISQRTVGSRLGDLATHIREIFVPSQPSGK